VKIYNKLILIQRIIALLIILTLIVGVMVFYYLDNYPKVEVRYVDKIIKQKEVVTEYVEVESDIVWHDDFIITFYTQQDEGCNNITSIGVNLDKSWTRYFNFVAVDPKIIPYGKTVFIKIGDEIIESSAVDCGGAITGHHLDWYCRDFEEGYELMEKLDGNNVQVGWVR